MKNIDWKLIFDKVGTVIMDRRFWLSFFTLLAIVLGVPQLADQADSLSQEALDLVVLIVQVLALVGIPLRLSDSWTKRAPTGLRFKEPQVSEDVTEFIEALVSTVKK